MFTLGLDDGLIAQRPKIPRPEVDNVRNGFFERDQFEPCERGCPSTGSPSPRRPTLRRLAGQVRERACPARSPCRWSGIGPTLGTVTPGSGVARCWLTSCGEWGILVELSGIEPPTSALRTQRSPS